MHKILTLVKREYQAAVKTKSFIISLLLVPIMMGGSFIAILITENNKDTSDKNIAIIDHSGELQDLLQEKADYRNSNQILSKAGEKIEPAYILEFIEPADTSEAFEQRLELSKKVRAKELTAFVEIGKDILRAGEQGAVDYIKYYSENSSMDEARHWFPNQINPYVRQKKIEALNLPPEQTQGLFKWVNVQGLGLAKVDKKTGVTKEAEHSSDIETFLIPYVIVILMFMLSMMSTSPLLSAVMEEKTEKIAEVLLGKVTPFQFMMGKVVGGVAVGLTVAAIYIAAAVFTMRSLDVGDMIPTYILPWFFAFLLLNLFMVGSGMTALGATANDNKDAQSLMFPAMLPIIFPLFVMMPLIQNPSGAFATTMSFIPPFTPAVMMIRMATPVSIPVWQPILGLVLVILFTLFTVWIGARVFRTAILIQGQKPTIKNLMQYAFKK